MAVSGCNTTVIDERGYEIQEHGTSEFPVGCYQDDITVELVPWHWHDEYELVFVLKGDMICAANSKKLTIHEGEGIFVNSGVLHSYWNAREGVCITHALVFHPRLVGGSPNSIFWLKYIAPLSSSPSLQTVLLLPNVEWQRQALHYCREVWDSVASEQSGYEFVARAGLSQLIYLLTAHHSIQEIPVSEKELRERKRVKIMLQFIHDNIGKELSSKDISASASISESECLRCFQSVIGMPPIHYLREYRIQQAAGLLAATHRRISDIGCQCGFQEMSYFTRTFRQLRGCTPSEYRKKYQITEKNNSIPKGTEK